MALGVVRSVSGLPLSEAVVLPLRSGRNTLWLNTTRAEQILQTPNLGVYVGDGQAGNRQLGFLCNLAAARASGCQYVRVGFPPRGAGAWVREPALEASPQSLPSCCC
jgi:hypothetical protein